MTEEEAEAAALEARRVGHILIDTAVGYEDEAVVGRAVRRRDHGDRTIGG